MFDFTSHQESTNYSNSHTPSPSIKFFKNLADNSKYMSKYLIQSQSGITIEDLKLDLSLPAWVNLKNIMKKAGCRIV